MKRKDLEQLRALNQELETLRKAYRFAPAEDVGDTYGDYRTGRKIVKVMYGKSSPKKRRLEKEIGQKADAICGKLLEMEAWINAVEDAEMRDILRLYYAVGLTQEEIGGLKGYERSSIGKKIDRFWEQEEEDSEQK